MRLSHKGERPNFLSLNTSSQAVRRLGLFLPGEGLKVRQRPTALSGKERGIGG